MKPTKEAQIEFRRTQRWVQGQLGRRKNGYLRPKISCGFVLPKIGNRYFISPDRSCGRFFSQCGLKSFKVGEDARLTVTDFNLKGGKLQNLRTACNTRSHPNITLLMDQYVRVFCGRFGKLRSRSPIGLVLLNLGGIGFFTFLCNWWVSRAGGFPLFDSVAETPENEVGLVLGTAPMLENGFPNRYFVFRMNAAAELFHAGKVKVLILSGNRRADGYDEPAAMRAALVARGVPNGALLEDPAGVRTLQSVARVKSSFGVSRLTVISQEFHNRRALFFCKHLQITAVGLNANPVLRRPGWRLTCREFVARAVAVLNICGAQAKPILRICQR